MPMALSWLTIRVAAVFQSVHPCTTAILKVEPRFTFFALLSSDLALLGFPAGGSILSVLESPQVLVNCGWTKPALPALVYPYSAIFAICCRLRARPIARRTLTLLKGACAVFSQRLTGAPTPWNQKWLFGLFAA